MKLISNRWRKLALAAVLWAAPGFAHIEPNMAMVEWQISSRDHCVEIEGPKKAFCGISSNHRVFLRNHNNAKSISYGERKYGINLVWGMTPADYGVSFETERGGAISYNQRVAFKLGGRSIVYKERKYGINLDWSVAPVYEWEIRTGNVGGNVNAAMPVGLYNRVADDYLVNCSRDYGIDLKWARDCDRENKWMLNNQSYVFSTAFFTAQQPKLISDCPKAGSYVLTLRPVRLFGSKGLNKRTEVTEAWNQISDPNPCAVVRQTPPLASGVWSMTLTHNNTNISCIVSVPGPGYRHYQKGKPFCDQSAS